MSDVDPSGLKGLMSEMVAAETRKAFDKLAAAGALAGLEEAAARNAPTGNETLAWLAGNRNPDRRKGVQPPTGVADPHADNALSQPKPADPVEAAQKRAAILADLHRESPRDPRVRAVFEADPIVAEDPGNGNLVTKSMLIARGDIFDAVLTMLGHAVLPRGARSRLEVTLKSAYTMLSDDAQVEWAMSEVRLEETKAYLETREQADLNTLGQQLEIIMTRSDLWAAARTFSMAAHIGLGESQGSAALADLLEMRDIAD